MKYQNLFPILLFLTLGCFNCYAESLISIETSQKKIELAPFIEILEDQEGKWSFKDISSPTISKAFKKAENENLMFGYTDSVFWVRARILNQSENEDWILEIDYPGINYVDVYVSRDTEQGYDYTQSGNFLPFNHREIQYRKLTFALSVPQNTTKIVYLRIETEELMTFPLKLWERQEFNSKTFTEQIIMGLYFGIILVMAIYNFFLFVSLRDRTYLLFVLFTCCLGFMQAGMQNLGYQYVFYGDPLLNRQMIFINIGLTIIFGTLFSYSFLKVKEYARLLVWPFRLLFFGGLIFCVLVPFLGYRVSVIIGNGLTPLAVLLSVAGCVAALRKGFKPARYYLISWTAFFCGAALNIGMGEGLLPVSLFTQHGVQIGSALQVTLLAFGLADRIKILRLEKDRAQAESLKNKSIAVENLKKSDQLKNEFLAKSSHELRTPLHGIIGLADSLYQDQTASLSASFRNDLKTISISGKRLASVVDDILDFSSIKHGDIRLNLKSIDLGTIIQVVATLTRPLARAKGLTFSVEIAEDLPAVVADENRIQQILHNLLGNAIKYTDQGTVTISARSKRESVEIRVSDTGIGIDDANISDIFKSFEQLGSSISRSEKGLGLGLSITKNLVEAQNGQIWVESAIGAGSTFFFTLPVSNSRPMDFATQKLNRIIDPPFTESKPLVEEDDNQKDSFNKRNTRYSIRCIDDDPTNHAIIRRYLALGEFEVITNIDAVSALDSIRRDGKPDLILLDIMMPNMSGFEFCAEIRKDYQPHDLPIIFLTARDQVSDLVEAFSLGANDYLTKPFSREELLTRVNNQLRQLEIHNRLTSLRMMTREILKTKDAKSVMRTVLRTLFENISCRQASLFQENQLLLRKSQNPDLVFGDALPTATQLSELTPEPHQEIGLFNNVKPDHFLVTFYKEQDDVDLAGDHLAVIHIQGMEAFTIVLHRKSDTAEFSDTDLEYIKNIIHAVSSTRESIQELTYDAKLIKAIHEIHESLADVVYIKSDLNTCTLFTDKENNHTSLFNEEAGLWTSEYLIPMNHVQTYFREENLLRVHRSYFVNPAKIINIKRKTPKSPDYEVSLQIESGDILKINVGRNYIPKLKKTLSRFF